MAKWPPSAGAGETQFPTTELSGNVTDDATDVSAFFPYRTSTRPLTQTSANEEKTPKIGPEPTSTAPSGAAGDG